MSQRSKLACDPIDWIDKDRERRPTREDIRYMLEKHEDNLFFFNFCFRAPNEYYIDKKNKEKPVKSKTSKIVHILWENYGLYKLRSNEEKPHSLNRSMYIGLIKEGGKIISRHLHLGLNFPK